MTDIKPQQENHAPPSFLRRIPLAFGTFFRILFNRDYALQVGRLRHPAPSAPEPAPPLREAPTEAALQLLSLLQRDARLLDFTTENLGAYTDAEIGTAARVVHEGCRKVLEEHFTIVAVRPEAEGSRITLPEGFDAAAVRLTGNVVGRAPFQGSLTHRGWRVTEIRLPKLAKGHDASVLAPAEVEL
jgi:hypothetical protein